MNTSYIKPKSIAAKYATDDVTHAEAYEVSEYGGVFRPEDFALGGAAQKKTVRRNNETQTGNAQEQQ